MRLRCERSAAVVLQWVKLCFLVIIIIGTALVQPGALAAHSDDDALIIGNGTAQERHFTICAALKKPYVYPSRLCELSAASDNNIIMESFGSFGSDDDIISNASSNLSCTFDSEPLALDISTFVNSFQGMDVDLLQAIQQMAFPDSATIQVLVYRSRSAILVETRPGGLCDMSIGGLVRDSKASRPSNACSRPGSLDDLTEEDFCGIAYSKSYYRDGLALVTREPKEDFSSMVLSVARNNSVLSVLSIIVLALLASGHLIWFLERKDNPGQFPSAYLDGVDDGLWWSVVTMTTVGYGDKTPTTVLGRALGVLWMFLGLGLFGFFNAVMIGEMGKRKPLHEVASVSDPMLEGSKFCTHPENAWFLRHEAVLEDRILTTANITECYEKLLFEEVDVVLHDRMAILPDISDFVDDLPHKPQTWKQATDHCASPLDLVSSGVDVSRLLGFSYFSAAFPQDGALEEVVSGAIRSLADGHVVFGHDQDLFRGGWSLELAEHKYTMTTLKPTDGVHSTPHVPAISVSTQMLCSFAAISMAVYLVAQFGGLWFRMAWMKWRIRAGIIKEPDAGISFQNQTECPQLKELRELKLMHRKSVEIQEKQFNEGMDNLNKRIEAMREQHSKTIHEVSTAVRGRSADNVDKPSSTEKSRFSLHLPGGWTSYKKPPMKLAAIVPIGDNFLTAAPRVPSIPELETERHHPPAGRTTPACDQKTQLDHHHHQSQVSSQGLADSSLLMPNFVKSDDLRSGHGTRANSGKGGYIQPDPSPAVLNIFAET